MVEKTSSSDPEFFKWLREKELAKENELNKEKFEPQHLYITIQPPPAIKKKNTDLLSDDDEDGGTKETFNERIDFNIEYENTDNTIVYKL